MAAIVISGEGDPRTPVDLVADGVSAELNDAGRRVYDRAAAAAPDGVDPVELLRGAREQVAGDSRNDTGNMTALLELAIGMCS